MVSSSHPRIIAQFPREAAGLNILFVLHPEGILDLVTTGEKRSVTGKCLLTTQNVHGTGSTAVGVVVVGALGLVEGLLGATLALVGLGTAGEAVGGVGDSLLDLVLGGLGGVGGHLLLGLCGLEWLVLSVNLITIKNTTY